MFFLSLDQRTEVGASIPELLAVELTRLLPGVVTEREEDGEVGVESVLTALEDEREDEK